MSRTRTTRTKAKSKGTEARPLRADAQQNLDALLRVSTEVFAEFGVDAPMREIAERAGVGLGTIYRHFPLRSDLIAAVMRLQVDECADAADTLAKQFPPDDALAQWLHRFIDLLGTKRGLAAALHSGEAAYSALPGYFLQRVGSALRRLLDRAVEAERIRAGVDAEELLWTVATMCQGPHGQMPSYSRKMVGILIDGLRYVKTAE